MYRRSRHVRPGSRDRQGLGDLFEPVLGLGVVIDIRVKFAGQCSTRLLDRLLVGGLLDAEDLVVVLAGGGYGALSSL
jgi:hypothetical protein